VEGARTLATKASATAVFRIELLDVEPLIWRRIRVARSATFKELHDILQIVLGWQDSHLHEFRAGKLLLGAKDVNELDGRENLQDEDNWSLNDLLDTGVAEFEYVYDFGDDWVHRVLLEPATRSRVPGPSPLCLAGENACPPEDMGGPHRYAVFLEAIADPAHEEHKSYLQWIGGVWDPKGFDLNRVNRDLRSGRRRKP
jgi:hypothetical protein